MAITNTSLKDSKGKTRGLSKKDLLKMIEKLSDDSIICITQDNSYNENDYAEFHEKPVLINEEEKIYSIAFSKDWN